MDNFDHQLLAKHTFGLVDASRVEELPAGVASEALVPSDLSDSGHLMPLLINLRSMPAALQEQLLESIYDAHLNAEQPVVALLAETTLDATTFGHHWNRLQLVSPQPSAKAWLRLHDPRVLHQLLRMASGPQRRQLFGRSEALTYWVGGEWVTAQAHEGPGNTSHNAEYAGPARWDWTRIGRIGLINRALSEADVRGADALSEQGHLVEQLIERGSARHGLVDPADLIEFAVRGLQWGARFDEHPKIAPAIRPPADENDESGLAYRLDMIDEQVWHELRAPDMHHSS